VVGFVDFSNPKTNTCLIFYYKVCFCTFVSAEIAFAALQNAENERR